VAKIQCRNFPDNLFERLEIDAQKNERSLEGHVRFLLTETLTNSSTIDEDSYFSGFIPEWMLIALKLSAKQGFRNLKYEVIKRLTESLDSDGIYPPGEEKDEAHKVS